MTPLDRLSPLGGTANGLSLKSAARAVKARPAYLLPSVNAEEAFRLTLQQCKWHVLANVPAVLEANAPEGVHQLRVALRRLRVALAACGEEFRAPPMEALRMRAQILAQGLAPARDLDVFTDELFEPAARANGSVEAFAVLRERARAALARLPRQAPVVLTNLARSYRAMSRVPEHSELALWGVRRAAGDAR